MSVPSRSSYIIGSIVLAASIASNIFLYYSHTRTQFILNVVTERLRINEDEKSELAFSQFSKMNENMIELARGQGRIEAYANIAQNLPVQDSDVSAIFHAGLDSGYGTALQLLDSIVSNVEEKVVATVQKIPSIEETRIPAGNTKNNVTSTKEILDYWNSSKKFLKDTINTKISENKKNEYSWKNALISKAREIDIQQRIQEARDEGRLEGYHDATEDGVCPAPTSKKTPPATKK